ncbi:hypothetical protein ES703_45269 [subsurface metagenome]
MNIPEAIRLVRKDIDNPGSVTLSDLNPAQELLIEAGKAVLEDEYRGTEVPRPLLPGESKE